MFQSICKYSKWVCMRLVLFFPFTVPFSYIRCFTGKRMGSDRLSTEAGLCMEIEYLMLLASPRVQK